MIIHLQIRRWRPGQRLAIGGATAALVAAVAWVWLGEPGATLRAASRAVPFEAVPAALDGHAGSLDTRAPVRAPAARPPAAASVDAAGTAAPSTPPFQYVGHWKEHGATTVVLSDRGRNLLVRVPGAFDDRYHILSVDEHRLVMKVLPLGIVQTLALSPGAPWTVREPARPATPTPAVAAPVVVPEPEQPWARTAVRRKPGDAESSMEAPGLPVTPAGYGANAAAPEVEPEN